jgi:ankyrin repeat protein
MKKLPKIDFIKRIKTEESDDFDFAGFRGGVIQNRANVVKKFLKDGFKVDARIMDDKTALHLAVFFGNNEICKLLLEYGADPNIKDESGYIALHWARTLRNTSIYKLLLDNGTDPNSQDYKGQTPLHEACRYGNLEACKLLLQYKANPDVQNLKGATALHISSLKGYKPICELLIKYRANINIKSNRNKTPLYCSTDANHLGIIKLLLENGADPNIQRFNPKDSAIVTKYNNLSLRYYIDDIIRNINDDPAPHYMVDNSAPKVAVKDKWSSGISIQGFTSLIRAVTKGYFKICKLLLEYGADPTIKDCSGHSAVFYAANKRYHNIVMLLVEAKDKNNLPLIDVNNIENGINLAYFYKYNPYMLNFLQTHKAHTENDNTEIIFPNKHSINYWYEGDYEDDTSYYMLFGEMEDFTKFFI